MPATANHTLPVHAIQYDGDVASTTRRRSSRSTRARTTAGRTSSRRRATAARARRPGSSRGIAGLALLGGDRSTASTRRSRRARRSRSSSRTADDIDVPESREPESTYRWSQPGFDQRFGYGRVNANRARRGDPRRQASRPRSTSSRRRWFSGALQGSGRRRPIDIDGTVSAHARQRRTTTWSSGRPACSRSTASSRPSRRARSNVAADDGRRAATGPLASLDIRTIDLDARRATSTARAARTTQRSRCACAPSRTTAARSATCAARCAAPTTCTTIPTLVKGFPIYLGDSGEAQPEDGRHRRRRRARPRLPDRRRPAPRLQDHADGPGRAARASPSRPNRDRRPRLAAARRRRRRVLPRGAGVRERRRRPRPRARAVRQRAGDRRPRRRRQARDRRHAPAPGTIYVVEPDGKRRSPGWPKRLPDVPSCPLDPDAPPAARPVHERARRASRAARSPRRCSSTGQGRQARHRPGRVRRQRLRLRRRRRALSTACRSSSTTRATLAEEPRANRILTTPAVADFNGDGIPDLLVGSNEQLGEAGSSGAHLPRRRTRHERARRRPFCRTGRSR